MKRSFIYDQGTAKEQEDGLINTARIIGVLDGVSKPHSSLVRPISLNMMTSGEWLVRLVERIVREYSEHGGLSLVEVLGAANTAIDEGLKDAGFNLPKELRPGATFALANVSGDSIELVQGGDSFFAVLLKDGGLEVSPYQMREFEKRAQPITETCFRLAARCTFGCDQKDVPETVRADVRRKFWEFYLPEWIELKKEMVNTAGIGFGLLNGEPEIFFCSRTYDFRDVKKVLFFTDGLVPKKILVSEDDEGIGRYILGLFEKGGWPAVLAAARQAESQIEATNYISQAEATGYALEF